MRLAGGILMIIALPAIARTAETPPQAAQPADARAATYSRAGDFSSTENRANSVWSFRLDDPAKRPRAFLPLLASNKLNAKMLWGPDFGNPPMMWSECTGYWGIGKNTTGVEQTGSGVTWAPGEVLLHPKDGAAPAGLVIAWTAPRGMVIDVNYTFARAMAQGQPLIPRPPAPPPALATAFTGRPISCNSLLALFTPACDEPQPNHNPEEPDAFIALVRPVWEWGASSDFQAGRAYHGCSQPDLVYALRSCGGRCYERTF